MRNSLTLPVVAIVSAVILAGIAGVSYWLGADPESTKISQVEIGLLAWALLLVVYGIQGIISVIAEGEEMVPEKMPARLTETLTAMIVLFSILLAAAAVVLAFGISGNMSTLFIGIVAGIGSIILGLLLVFYKEAFLGDEAQLDDRDDGIPW